jgi:hypothetical protein
MDAKRMVMEELEVRNAERRALSLSLSLSRSLSLSLSLFLSFFLNFAHQKNWITCKYVCF